MEKLLTLWSRILLEKLTGSQLVKNFPAFYGTHKFITAFTSARHLSLSWAPTSHFLKIHLNIILPSTPGSRKWFLSLRFPQQNPIYIYILFPIRATCPPPHLLFLDFITRTILGEEYRSLSSSLPSFLHSPVTLPLLGPNIFLNTLFSNTLSLRSSLNVSDQVSRPQKKISTVEIRAENYNFFCLY
jgi:hypothetical protein